MKKYGVESVKTEALIWTVPKLERVQQYGITSVNKYFRKLPDLASNQCLDTGIVNEYSRGISYPEMRKTNGNQTSTFICVYMCLCVFFLKILCYIAATNDENSTDH